MKKLLAALALMASPAYAQPQCMGYPDLAAALTSEFSESVAGRGLSNGNIAEIWVNPNTGTWTLVVVTPNGIACIAGHGTNWETYSTGQPS
jgi:hypothetical protein